MDHLTNTYHTVGNLILMACAWVLTFSGLPVEPVFGLIFMMLADLVTGMVRAARHGEELTSHRFKSGFLVKMMILIVPATIAVVSQSASAMYPEVGDMREVVKFSVMAIIVGEAVSVLGNINSARTGNPKVEWDYLSWLIGKLYRFLKSIDKR